MKTTIIEKRSVLYPNAGVVVLLNDDKLKSGNWKIGKLIITKQ